MNSVDGKLVLEAVGDTGTENSSCQSVRYNFNQQRTEQLKVREVWRTEDYSEVGFKSRREEEDEMMSLTEENFMIVSLSKAAKEPESSKTPSDAELVDMLCVCCYFVPTRPGVIRHPYPLGLNQTQADLLLDLMKELQFFEELLFTHLVSSVDNDEDEDEGMNMLETLLLLSDSTDQQIQILIRSCEVVTCPS
ncbi:hypothetical protein Q8A73_018199 [Channa argus]|nr:hypothetical protein Q8A73_018199 [Channa argus]